MTEYVTLVDSDMEALFDRAEAGEAAAQEEVANYYLLDGVLAQDLPRALSWLTKATNQGRASAQRKLGMMLFYGLGTKTDQRRGLELLELAANQRDAEAFYVLGRFYEEGLGVPKNTEKAEELFLEATLEGFEPAIFALLRVEKKKSA